MKKRPIPVVLVSLLFILAGLVGFIYHFTEFFVDDVDRGEVLWVELVRIVAVICGIFLLMAKDWARWLAIAWLLYHVVIGALHSPSQMIAHILLLLVVAVLLYLPISSSFFKPKSA